MHKCGGECLFNLCKVYTYLEQIYKKHFSQYIHYYTTHDLDISKPFYDFHGSEFFIHKLVLNNNAVLTTMNESSTFQSCNFKFLNVTIHFNDEEYTIELEKPCWNFYCVNNRIDVKFLYWYMKNVLYVDNFDDSYVCCIIDNNYQFIEFDKDSYVELGKDSYEVIYNKY